MGRPLASSSTSLSMYRTFRISGSSIFLDANPADDAGDLACVGMERRRLAEEGLDISLA